MSQSSDLRSTTEHEYMKMFGDVVVGSFNHSGKRLKKATLTGSREEIIEKQKQYIQHAARSSGATPLQEVIPVKGNKSKNKKNKKAQTNNILVDLSDNEPELIITENSSVTKSSVRKKTVYLHNKLGKIKLFVEEVLNSEMAYCLVFASEDDIIFIPNPAETLNFTDEAGDTTSVYYADTLFSWTDGIKKLMILFKSNE